MYVLYIYTHTYIHTYIHTYVYIYIYICMYVCMYVYIHIYICIHRYRFTYTHIDICKYVRICFLITIKARCPIRGAMIAAPGAIACLGALSAIPEIRKEHFSQILNRSASVWLQWTKTSAALQVTVIRECWMLCLFSRRQIGVRLVTGRNKRVESPSATGSAECPI